MKKIALLSTLILIVFALNAQEWNTTGSNISNANTGNVGIGLTSPARKLHVYGSGSNFGQWLENTGTAANETARFSFKSASGGADVRAGVIEWYDGSSFKGDLRLLRAGGMEVRNSNDVPVFNIFNNGNAGIAGNIGIGCPPSQSKITVYGGSLGGTVNEKVDLFQLQNHAGANISFLDIFSLRSSSGSDWLSSTTRIQQTVDGTQMGFIDFNPKDNAFGIALGTSNTQRFIINGSGQVGIAVNPQAGYILAVNGNSLFTKIKVKAIENWPDYVFADNYKLRPLGEVEKFIEKNKHLPEVPSANEVKAKGLDVGDNQAILLKKIEELTLYLIEQDRRIEQVESVNKELKEENERIRTKLAEIVKPSNK